MAPPFDDTTDFEDAERGFVGAMDPCVVSADDGRVVWDNDAYSFLGDACPGTANPSLWRQSQLCAKQGLFEVTEGIYQVRGLDLSNMTLVEGDEGVIVKGPEGRSARAWARRPHWVRSDSSPSESPTPQTVERVSSTHRQGTTVGDRHSDTSRPCRLRPPRHDLCFDERLPEC